MMDGMEWSGHGQGEFLFFLSLILAFIDIACGWIPQIPRDPVYRMDQKKKLPHTRNETNLCIF